MPPIKVHYLRHIKLANKFIFDNKKKCKSFHKNIIDWKDAPKADLVYFDPPYGGHTDYEATYHYIEGMTTTWHGWKDKLHCKNLRIKTGLDKPFSLKDKIYKSFATMFNNMNHIPNLLVSSNSDQKPNTKEMIEMIKKEGYKDIKTFSKTHQYIQQAQGWNTDHPKVVEEILILARK